MENLSAKVIPAMPDTFQIPSGAMGPNDKDILAQLNAAHPIQISEAKYENHEINLNSHMILNHHGIGAQLRYMMELNAASKVGRLPFLKSSNLTRDILLGRDETISPADIYGSAEFPEKMPQPHAFMEKRSGLL